MRFLTFRDKKKLTTSKCTLKISIFANTMSNIIHMKATREYFVDVIKVIDEIKEKDGCNPDDIFDELSPEHGQAIMDQLIQRSCIESTFDGWFVNNKGELQVLRNECESKLKDLDNSEMTLQYSKQTMQYSKQDNLRGWITIGISIISLFFSIWAFIRTF